MRISVASRAHRCLSGLLNYRSISNLGSQNNFMELTADLSLHLDDSIIGVYENFPGQKNELIVLSEKSLYIYTLGNWIEIPFSKLIRVYVCNSNPGFKESLDSIQIDLNDNRSISLPIRGVSLDGRSRDVFSFFRFMMRVLEDRLNEKS